jgi:sugar phosphate isomerase/epimerase
MAKTWTWAVTGYQMVGKTTEEICQTCNAAGLAGIEGAPPLFEGLRNPEIEAVGRACREAGVSIETFHLPFSGEDDIASFYETVRTAAVDKMKRWMEIAVAAGATVGIQHPTTSRNSVDVEGLDHYRRQIGKSLEALLPAARSLGFTVAIENMLPSGGGRFCSRTEHFKHLAADFGGEGFGFCLDTGHALCAAGSPAGVGDFFDVMAPHMAAFHLADNAGDRDSHLMPGRGLVDWDAFFRKAEDLGFSRSMCIETPPFAPGPDYSQEAYNGMVREADALVAHALGTTP